MPGEQAARNRVVALNKSIRSIDTKKNGARDMSEYLKHSKDEISLQIGKISHQLNMIEALGKMSDKYKIKYTFDLLDKDNNKHISASELSDGIRKVNAGSLNFQESLQKTINDIVRYDKDQDATLNLDEFEIYLSTVSKETGTDYRELCELIIMQLLFSETGNTDEEMAALKILEDEIGMNIIETENFNEAFNDEVMRELFELFDLDKDYAVNFSEVAIGLYCILEDIDEATKLTVDIMLMLDVDDERKLSYDGFVRLILNFCAASNNSFDTVKTQFILNMHQVYNSSLDVYQKMMVANEFYDEMKNLEVEQGVMNALHYGKMHKLFALCDLNNDGFISFEELATAMRKFHKAAGISMDYIIEKSFFSMIGFDKDKNQKLDKEEFALFIVGFAQQNSTPDNITDLHELIDFLAVTSLSKENTLEEENYIRAVSAQWTKKIKALQDKMFEPATTNTATDDGGTADIDSPSVSNTLDVVDGGAEKWC